MKKFFVFMIFLLCSVITFPDEVATNKSETKEEYLYIKMMSTISMPKWEIEL